MPAPPTDTPASSQPPAAAAPCRVLAVLPAERRAALEAALARHMAVSLQVRWHDDAAAALAEAGAGAGSGPGPAVLLLGADGPADAVANLPVGELRRLDAVVPVLLLLAGEVPPAQWDLLEHLAAAGLQDVLTPADLGPTLGLRLRLAASRRAHTRAASGTLAIDAATGLPTRLQLVEHMSHLIALREREPAPMGVLVVRIERPAPAGSVADDIQHGLLRRKIAVRLRGVLRASDVVASLEPDQFGVLLSAIDQIEHADGVAAKLLSAVQRPFSLSGHPQAVAGAVGVRVFPRDGVDAAALLEAAASAARAQPATARGGLGAWQTGGVVPPAANDE